MVGLELATDRSLQMSLANVPTTTPYKRVSCAVVNILALETTEPSIVAQADEANSNIASAIESKEDILRAMTNVRLNSNPDVVPLHGGPVEVTLSMDLSKIREVDTVRGEVEIIAMVSILWKDHDLSWLSTMRNESGSSQHSPDRVDSFRIAVKRLWSPDIVAYNPVTDPELLSPPIALVSADGTVLYVPNLRIRFRCNLEDFEKPQGANCTLNYGSWTHDGNKISLKENGVSVYDYEVDPRFDLLGTFAEVEVKYYPCCPEPYPLTKFTFNIKKKSRSIFSW
ncbi:acetylcholine receptor subunit alpha-like 2 [Plakobranchus ocellatus]|uniref:Acetylcholine receptor subunit alpha-like 2 n=1 Tax=Plakobranchus ocellatus TaxID=259542 RepID=A0AAV3YF95_9GAST|nr:acetylcholine receptor subunit alpha-like 2 [Plakobranchus ocellatus]